VPADTGRLLDLLSSFSVLRTNSQVLVKQIRGSIDEMRELRNQLRQQQSALAHAGANGTRDPDPDLRADYGLTRREVQVAMLIAKGRSNSAIAEALSISGHTARHHTQRILAKLGVHSRAEAGARIRG
jgi:DNA-binding NarL/FixJ family response regulator